MAVTISNTNKPLIPRSNDLSEKKFNRASLYSGKALDFDGANDYVESSEKITGITDEITIVGLVYSDTLSVSNNRTFTQWDGSAGWFYQTNGANGDIFFRLKTSVGNGDLITTTQPIKTGVWNFITCTYDGASMKFYLNSNLIQSVAHSGTITETASQKFRVGTNEAFGQAFDGKVTGTKVFNVALTQSQVSDLYLNPEKIVPDGVANSALKLWLPMMEGAGTTAYDGSGNGNHGTINGATWVSGIGAPVAQTALVGWNKGTNLLTYSEQFDNAAWTKNLTSATANQTTSPSGYVDADLIDALTGTGQHFVNGVNFSYTTGTAYTFSAFAKKGNTSLIQLFTPFATFGFNAFLTFNFDTLELTTGASATASVVNYGSGWYRLILTATSTASGSAPSFYASFTNDKTVRAPSFTAANETFYLWGAQTTQTSTLQPYIPTLATAQTSPVLLPQGLTANKDITGVNSVSRNAYALNLDGKSWAEVHDNASLDFGTGAFTMEVWVIGAFVNAGSSYNSILTLGNSVTDTNTATLNSRASQYNFTINLNSVNFSTIDLGDWTHLAVTRNSSGLVSLYYNGSLDGSGIYAFDVTNTANPRIGADSTTSRYYNDQLALPRIYNRALTATEVARNYNADKSKFGL